MRGLQFAWGPRSVVRRNARAIPAAWATWTNLHFRLPPFCLFVSCVAGAASVCDRGLLFTSGTSTYQLRTAAGTSSFASRSVIQGNQIPVLTTDASGKVTFMTWLCSSKAATLKTEPGGMAIRVQNSFLSGGAQLRPGYSRKSGTQLGGLVRSEDKGDGVILTLIKLAK